MADARESAPQTALGSFPEGPFSSESFYRKAARAAWVAPLVAIALNYCNHANPTPQPPRVQFVFGLIATALILTGFIAGVIALVGAATYRRASIIVPAIIGVSFNGLIILALLMVLHLAGKVSTASAAMRQRQERIALAQGAQEGQTSVMEYGGWVGKLSTASGVVAVTSLDDQSPTARRLLNDLPDPCSVLFIIARPTRAHAGVQLEPSSLSMEFANGRIVHALDGNSILGHAKDDPDGLLLKFNAAYRPDPAQDLYESFCLIPAGTDLCGLRSVTFLINGKRITIHGRFLSAKEKQMQYRGN